MKAIAITIIIAALCGPAAADWRDDAKDAVQCASECFDDWQQQAKDAAAAPCADCSGWQPRPWSLFVALDGRHVTIPGYADVDDCMTAGLSVITKEAEDKKSLPWFCVLVPVRE
jgi:hypothetical protein